MAEYSCFLWILIFTFLGFARYPYYKNFHTGFDGSLFFGLHENLSTLLWNVNADYPILWMLLGILAVSGIFFWIWRWVNHFPYWPLPNFKNKVTAVGYQIMIIACLVVFGITAGNGGSPLEAWAFRLKNSAVLTNDSLNEAIVDDVQGLYRAWDENKRLAASSKRNLSPDEMKRYLKKLPDSTKQVDSTHLSDYVVRYSEGHRIPPPKRIFIIISESYAQWPMLPEYQKYHLNDGMLKIAGAPEGAWLKSILTNGDSTISAVTAVVTGFAETGQVTTYQPETHNHVYETALAPQMSKLGYETYFWYGGPSGWMGLKKYALDQGFKEFNGSGELGLGASENRWGSADKDFLATASTEIGKITQPAVHVVLTISNHSPYTIDLEKEGFPKEEVRKQLPANLQGNEELLTEMGHQWYADREISRFILNMQQEEPDSLFILVGDHGNRTMYVENPIPFYQKQDVPLIIYGKGVSPKFFPQEVSGMQIQIIPTLIELIAPKNFEYYSLMPPLTQNKHYGVNSGYWLSAEKLGKRNENKAENYIGVSSAIDESFRDKEWEEAIFAYSWWRVVKGNNIQ